MATETQLPHIFGHGCCPRTIQGHPRGWGAAGMAAGKSCATSANPLAPSLSPPHPGVDSPGAWLGTGRTTPWSCRRGWRGPAGQERWSRAGRGQAPVEAPPLTGPGRTPA